MRKDAQEKNEGPLTSTISKDLSSDARVIAYYPPTHSKAWGTAARDEDGCGVGTTLKLQG